MSLLPLLDLQEAELLSALEVIQSAELGLRGQDLRIARHMSLPH